MLSNKDWLDELFDFSEDEVDELLEITEDDEELELKMSNGLLVVSPSLHAVKVRTIAAAVTVLKIFLIFIAFFLSINKKVRSRSHAPKNAKLRLLRHNFR